MTKKPGRMRILQNIEQIINEQLDIEELEAIDAMKKCIEAQKDDPGPLGIEEDV